MADKNNRKKVIPDETFRLIVESVPNGIVMTDSIGQIIFLNSYAEEMFGYKQDELIGKSVEEFLPESFRQNHVNFRSDYMKNPVARPMGRGRESFLDYVLTVVSFQWRLV